MWANGDPSPVPRYNGNVIGTAVDCVELCVGGDLRVLRVRNHYYLRRMRAYWLDGILPWHRGAHATVSILPYLAIDGRCRGQLRAFASGTWTRRNGMVCRKAREMPSSTSTSAMTRCSRQMGTMRQVKRFRTHVQRRPFASRTARCPLRIGLLSRPRSSWAGY